MWNAIFRSTFPIRLLSAYAPDISLRLPMSPCHRYSRTLVEAYAIEATQWISSYATDMSLCDLYPPTPPIRSLRYRSSA
eukprot:717755-Rhodomonas_salina.2